MALHTMSAYIRCRHCFVVDLLPCVEEPFDWIGGETEKDYPGLNELGALSRRFPVAFSADWAKTKSRARVLSRLPSIQGIVVHVGPRVRSGFFPARVPADELSGCLTELAKELP